MKHHRIFVWLVILLSHASYSFCQSDEITKIKYLDYYFDNASPLVWETQGDSIVKISLLPDYEREEYDRQTTHCYFRLVAEEGIRVKFLLTKLLNGYYNGVKVPRGRNWSLNFDNPLYISYDQKEWRPIETTKIANGEDLLVEITMEGKSVYIADIPPYTLTDLDKLKAKIRENDLVKIYKIGETVEERPIEIIQLGNSNAPYSFIVRARAHPWESGGNWVIEGLIEEFINSTSQKWADSLCVFILPMANKDGVARGMTRFTVTGMDLNRNWGKKPDPVLCPENHALEEFIEGLIAKQIHPSLAIDLHNDSHGGILLGQVNEDDSLFFGNIQIFENLMKRHTSFSEKLKFSQPPENIAEANDRLQFNDGLRRRFDIDAIVYELNAHWIGSLNKIPSKGDYMNIGKNMNNVFYEYATHRKKQ